MAMRYITVPSPQSIIDHVVNRVTNEIDVRGEKSYSYFQLLDEFVWNRPDWRKDEIHANVFNRVYDAHEEAKQMKLPYVELTQEDFAIFAPFATLKDVQLSGPNVAKLNRLTQCVTFASSTKPLVTVQAEQVAVAANGSA